MPWHVSLSVQPPPAGCWCEVIVVFVAVGGEKFSLHSCTGAILSPGLESHEVSVWVCGKIAD